MSVSGHSWVTHAARCYHCLACISVSALFIVYDTETSAGGIDILYVCLVHENEFISIYQYQIKNLCMSIMIYPTVCNNKDKERP